MDNLIAPHGGYRQLEELLLDYEDFLRQRGFALWSKDHSMAQAVRRLAYEEDRTYMTYRSHTAFCSAELRSISE